MDIAQLAQMVNWLDEEHRRDRAEIARLQQQIESQSADLLEQTRRIQDLEGRLASTHAQLGQFNQIDSQIQNIKQEFSLLVDREEEARSQSIRELERTRLNDREALSREIGEVRRELPRIGRLEEASQSRKGEDERLNEMISTVRNQVTVVAKEIEDRTRQIPFLAEQRTSDTKRIAQLQQETVELFKRIEAQAGRLPLLEEGIRRVGVEVEKMRPVPAELREAQQTFMERVRVELVDRLQVLNRWQETIDDQKSMVNQSLEQIQSFARQVDSARRAAQAMQEFQETLKREMAQVQELQRLSEERVRREMDEFREDAEKKRRREDLRQEHLWKEQDKRNRDVLEYFPPLIHDIKVHEEMLRQLWKLQEGYGARYLNAAQNWLDGLQDALRERDEQMKALEDDWQKQRRNTELYANQGNVRRSSGVVTSGERINGGG
jgi:hypothetical protein